MSVEMLRKLPQDMEHKRQETFMWVYVAMWFREITNLPHCTINNEVPSSAVYSKKLKANINSGKGYEMSPQYDMSYTDMQLLHECSAGPESAAVTKPS